MARRSSAPTAPEARPELKMLRDEAKSRLQDRMEKGSEFKQGRAGTAAAFEALKNKYSKWDSFNSELLKQMFTTEEIADEYDYWGIMSVPINPSLEEEIDDLYRDVDTKIHRLDSIIDRLEIIPLAPSIKGSSVPGLPSAPHRTKKVFVVHGRDEIAKTSLEVFLREVGLEPVVLHRQADEGMTVIEKFEKHSDVGYAFIILTPDEVAYLASEEANPDGERAKEFRARPNVIFEFGYFVGKLGRSRVCCLYTGNVSLPSDVSGMIYKRYEKNIDEIAYSVIKDLKASGYKLV